MTEQGGARRGRRISARRGWAELAFLELSLVSWLLIVPYLATAHGHLDFARHALGRDFVNLWTASKLEFTPRRAEIFEPTRFYAWERRLFDPRLAFHFWSYPPPALFLAAPLQPLRYFPALIVWSTAGLLLMVPAARAFFPPPAPAGRLLLLAPALAINLVFGQNGALTGAILLGGLSLFDRRPALSGALLGLLVFKPQLALLLPLAALSARRWSMIAAAAASAALLCLLSALVFGPDAWRGFFGPTLHAQSVMLSQGRGPFVWMMPTPFMSARALGLPAAAAAVVQAAFTLPAAGAVVYAFRQDWPLTRRSGVLLVATFLAGPQGFNYDLVAASAAAVVLLQADGDYRQLAGVLLWGLSPLLVAAQALEAPVGPPVVLFALAALLAPGFSPAETPRSSASMVSQRASKT